MSTDAVTAQPESAYRRPAALEIAGGYVTGRQAVPPLPRTQKTPREALDDAVRPALRSSPCLVLFSGGRDSSLVLSAAVGVARREGLPLPVPVTMRYPGDAAAEEASWQETVVGFLGLDEWVRIDYSQHADLLGEGAGASLRLDGVVWPPLVHSKDHITRLAAGGVILTGEGGDNFLGGQRSAPFALALHRRGRVDRAILVRMIRSATPNAIRREQLRRTLGGEWRWLQPEARVEFVNRVVADERAPWRWDRSLSALRGRLGWSIGTWNRSVHARRRHARYVEPLQDDQFVAALAAAGGAVGWHSRSATMQALFADLLPAEVLRRTQKASFNNAVVGPATRGFIEQWDGAGVDEALVDPEILGDCWRAETVHAGTLLLLQAAWLHSQGLPVTGAQSSERTW